MKVDHHIAISALISGILFATTKSLSISITSFIAGVFIDLDHIIDYIIAHGLCFNTKEFFDYFYTEKHEKITLVFHSWELLIILIAATKMTNFNPLVTGVLIGYGQHMVLDYILNKVPFFSYSMLYRWRKRFDSKIIFPRDRGYIPR